MNKIMPWMLSLLIAFPFPTCAQEAQINIKTDLPEDIALEQITKGISQHMVVLHQETQLAQNLKTLNGRLDLMMSDERVEKNAKATRNFYLELVKAGFTETEAMSIILANAALFKPAYY